jgi:hypothetical protein
MTRKGRAITLSLEEDDKERLRLLATDLGMTWGSQPNISKLIEAIARGEISLTAGQSWSSDRLNALDQARRLLIDEGYVDLAMAIAQLLLERKELPEPLRLEIQQFVQKPAFPWRVELERYIQQQQPFRLSYQDAADRIWQFTIRHAQIAKHEDRQYLDCWCDETEGNQDLPELHHNWCLRLDRIPEAAIAPIEGDWRPDFDHVLVELHLFSGLALAYRTKTDADTTNRWLPETPQVRQVIRRVTNTFWFFREILPYGENCVIVSPDAVRDRFYQKLEALMTRYRCTN